MVRAPSLAGDVASSFRISLTRTGEGAEAAWLAEVEEMPGSSARAVTPEEAARRAVASIDAAALVGGDDETDRANEARHSGRLLVRMPATLHDELARVAESEGVSLNQLITGVLASAVGWRASDDERGGTVTSAGDIQKVAGPDETWIKKILPRPSVGLALAANFLLVVLAAALAIGLLIVAWQQG